MENKIDVNITLAMPEDAENLINLLEQLKTESDTFTIDPELGKMSVQQQAQQIMLVNQTRGNVILLAKHLDKIIGLVTVQNLDDSDLGELGVAIIKKYWNYGLGTDLVKEAIHWGSNYSNLSTIALIVDKRNHAAVHLYQKCGFIFSTKRLINIHRNYHSTYEMNIKLKK
ncbi:GNAT family N-acetyltransferase [Apilactobacillus timberlakei]|uniref:GNAT family N-acetyltransferase n=1 Tax=Apilactobacillus timberlakei TaxID=2008380 RepID=UPI0011264D91|nr:GNAT family N-acetyltransferase [Apilactobacillus timberlakei]TPR17746.1 GNAT family N-acetyltransferase [Apilactobacillus timberlakei]